MKVISAVAFFEDIEQMLSEGKSIELRCFGSSMQPYLRGDGSEIIVASPFSSGELRPGAIVLFRYRGNYVCHRIVSRQKEKLLMQGDGTVKKQEEVSVSDVIGIIHTIIRRNKKPVSTHSKAAQRYWRCWLRLSPIRNCLLRVYRLRIKIFHHYLRSYISFH